MKCPNCKYEIPDGSNFCMHCGHRIEENNGEKHCSNPQCGKAIPSDSKFCPFCGTEVSSTSAENSVQDKLTFEVNGVSFNMIRVEGGTFTMGATPEQEDPHYDAWPDHQVTLSSYYIGETQVTQALWKAVMEDNPSNYEGEDLPIEFVSWHDCQKFINKLNEMTHKLFRLPTEAEWEFAARGGNKSQQTQYSGSNNINEVAWYEDNSNDEIHPVKSKKANELGIYDMSGNVYEWCQDWYGDYSSDAQTNPIGPQGGSRRIYRGGGMSSCMWQCYLYIRNSRTPDNNWNDIIGFRLVFSE